MCARCDAHIHAHIATCPHRFRLWQICNNNYYQHSPVVPYNNNNTMSSPNQAPGEEPYTHVEFQTSVGTFSIELYYRHTPRTCYNMAALAESGYYDNVIFHRIIPGFMLQSGDPTGTGRGGESIYGGKFADEITRNLKHTGAGIVSMANAGPNTNGSQFFVTLKSTPFLDGKHTIFGRIYSGMGVIQRMGMVPTDDEDRPRSPITIHQARPFRGPPPPRSQRQGVAALGAGQAHAQITAS